MKKQTQQAPMASTTAELTTLSRLLDQALDLEPAQIAGWLAALPEAHAHLCPQLRDMLAAHLAKSNPGFLIDGPRIAGGLVDDTVADPGDLIGPYRLIREIGLGGMGAVWLAERVDGSYKRQVALKLPRLAWGAGLAERMARERDIGALLEHPNIARLYDAGVDRLGRPYLALEYIDGQPIDAWCEAQQLSVGDRLRLFVQVAKAVAYAHGRLVVHRDLKPSNVLVTPDGQAHLLDFGIAKLLHEAAPDNDQLTQEQGRVMTPRYASPEQMTGRTITVASDVYSLGVLLYELLTGSFPYESGQRSRAAIEQAMFDDALPLASSRAQDKAMARLMRGEIDAILAKALKSEPSLRYATADALAEDIMRHLTGERVTAQPDSMAYRLRKVLSRHRAVFATGGVLGAALIAFSVVALVQANRALRSAERERMVKEFVSDIFRTSSRADGGTFSTRRSSADLLIERGAHLIESRFPGQPELQAELFGVVGGVFAEMGAYKLAVDYSGKQLAALRALPSPPPPGDEASVLMRMADALLNDGRLADAESRARAALSLVREPELRKQSLVLLSRIQLARGSYSQSEALADEAQRISSSGVKSISDAWLEWLSASTDWRHNRIDSSLSRGMHAVDMALAIEGRTSRAAADMRLDLGRRLVVNNRLREGLDQIHPALEGLEASGTAGSIRAAVARAELWGRMRAMELVSLEELRGEVTRSRDRLAAASIAIPDGLRARVDYVEGSALVDAGELVRGGSLLRESIIALRSETESTFRRFAMAGAEGGLNMLEGDHDKAATHFLEVIRLREVMGQAKISYAASDYASLVQNYLMAGDFSRARSVLDAAPAFEPLKSDPVSGHIYALLLPWERARLDLLQGHTEAALARVEKLRDDDDRGFRFSTHALRSEIYCFSGRPRAGLAIMNEVIAARKLVAVESDPVLARHRAIAGLCALNLGDRKTADQMAVAARSAFVVQPNVSSYFKVPSDRLNERLSNR